MNVTNILFHATLFPLSVDPSLFPHCLPNIPVTYRTLRSAGSQTPLGWSRPRSRRRGSSLDGREAYTMRRTTRGRFRGEIRRGFVATTTQHHRFTNILILRRGFSVQALQVINDWARTWERLKRDNPWLRRLMSDKLVRRWASNALKLRNSTFSLDRY